MGATGDYFYELLSVHTVETTEFSRNPTCTTSLMWHSLADPTVNAMCSHPPLHRPIPPLDLTCSSPPPLLPSSTSLAAPSPLWMQWSIILTLQGKRNRKRRTAPCMTGVVKTGTKDREIDPILSPLQWNHVQEVSHCWSLLIRSHDRQFSPAASLITQTEQKRRWFIPSPPQHRAVLALHDRPAALWERRTRQAKLVFPPSLS